MVTLSSRSAFTLNLNPLHVAFIIILVIRRSIVSAVLLPLIVRAIALPVAIAGMVTLMALFAIVTITVAVELRALPLAIALTIGFTLSGRLLGDLFLLRLTLRLR